MGKSAITVKKSFTWSSALVTKRFSGPAVYVENKKQHLEEKPFKCNICDKSFTWSSALGDHKKTHAEANADKPHQCDVCGKTFNALRYLNRHKNKHTEDEI